MAMSAIEKAAWALREHAIDAAENKLNAEHLPAARAAILAFLEDEGLVEVVAMAVEDAEFSDEAESWLEMGDNAYNEYRASASLAALRTLVTKDENDMSDDKRVALAPPQEPAPEGK